MSLKKETAKLSFFTAISLAGGMVFHILLGRTFGVSWQLDCFFVVLGLFNWLNICFNFITALYLPAFNEIKKENFRESIDFSDVVIKWTVITAIVISAGVLAGENFLFKILAPGFSERELALSRQLNGIIIYTLLFQGVSQVVILTLNALYYYTVPAILGILDPLFYIVALVSLTPVLGIKSVIVGYVALNVVKTIFLLWYFSKKTGWHITRLWFHRKLPALIGSSSGMSINGFIWGMRDLIIRNIASQMGEGVVTLFSYAEKIIGILLQLTVQPLSRVFYARVCEWAALKQWNDIRSLLLRTVRISVFTASFCVAASVVFLPSLLKIFFVNSKFKSGDIDALLLMFYILSVYFMILSIETFFSRIIYAVRRVKAVALISVAGVCFLILGCLGLRKIFGASSVALGVMVSQLLVCSLYYYFARNILQIKLFSFLKMFFNSFLIAAIFCYSGVVLGRLIVNSWLFLSFLPLWVLLYWFLARITLKEEMRILME